MQFIASLVAKVLLWIVGALEAFAGTPQDEHGRLVKDGWVYIDGMTVTVRGTR